MGKIEYELTFPQKNIWLVESYNKGTALNIIAGSVKINKGFNEEKCEVAINKVIEENVAMRTRIKEEKGKVMQYFAPYSYEKIEVVDLSSLSKKEILEYIDGLTFQSFFAKDKKLYNFKILKTGKNSGYIFMCIHHIISDAWSCSKIVKSLTETLETIGTRSENSEEKIVAEYTEYIEKEEEYKNSDKFVKDEEFWNEYLKGFSEVVSLKDKKKTSSLKANRYSVKLDKDLNDRITNYCKENKISPYALFLTAISIYIYRVKDKNDFVLGTPVLNRANFKEKQMLGMFVSTLPLRVKVEENIKFLDLAKEISKNNFSMFRHQKYPYSKMLEYVHKNSDIKNNLYNIAVSFQNAKTDIMDNDKYETNWTFSKALDDEMQIHISDIDDTGIYSINYDYKEELFGKIEVEYIHLRLMSIIENAIKDVDVDVENIEIMPESEKNKILYEFNNTKKEYPKDKTVIELFEEQVNKTPDNVALVFEGKEMTYKELNERANSLAHYLVESENVKPNDVIGLIFSRSFEMIIAILGTLKAGAAYLPIDPDFPEDRIKYILQNSEAKVVITNKKSITLNKAIYFDCNIFATFSNKNLNIKNDLKDLVYIIYTSGTTGKPKGVMIQHKNLLNLVFAIDDVKKLQETSISLSITNYTFDMFVIETLVMLFLGKKIILADNNEAIMPNKISELVERYKAQTMFITPSKMELIVENDKYLERLSTIKKLTIAGEKFSLKIYKKVSSKINNINIFNGYGPSEATVCSSVKLITDEKNITIGKPINNTQAYILDKKMRLLPLFTQGEIYISGGGVGKGYLNNKEQNNKSFFSFNNDVIYKTGDVAFQDFDGEMIYIGRIDNQVKINGQRIEIEEIEKQIEEENNVDNSCVIFNKNSIIAFIKPIRNDYSNEEIINRLKVNLSKKLPLYMLPSKYILVKTIPVNSSGKIDKNSLLNLIKENTEKCTNFENFTDVEKDIREIIKRVFNVEINNIDSSFTEYQLDSLDMIKLAVEINQKYNIDLTAKDVFENSNIFLLSKLVSNNEEIRVFDKISKRDEYPLTSSQFGIFTNYSKNPDTLAYNIPFEMKLSNSVNILRLKKALEEVINSDSIFFTKIFMKDGALYQKNDIKSEFNIDIYEVTEEEYKEKKLQVIKPFDLLNDLLFSINIFKTEKNVYVVINIHHIIFDGLSMYIFLEKLKSAYENKSIEKENEEFGQFALYEEEIKKTNKYKEAKEYFSSMFKDELPDNNMVLDYKRPNEKNFEGDRYSETLDLETSKMLYDFVNENKVTLSSVFLAMYNLTLSKYMYSTDIVLGIASSGRNIKEEMNKMGMFVKTTPFRTKLNGEEKVLDYIKNIQNKVLETMDYSIYPLESIVKDIGVVRDPSRNPLFDTMFVYQNEGIPELKIGGEKVELTGIFGNTSKFDITCEIMPVEDKFAINLEYDTSILTQKSVKRFLNHYINSIKYILLNKDEKLKDIEILSIEEKNKILNEYNNTVTDYPKDKTIVELFREQVERTPNNIAVVFEGNSLTYKELEKKSNIVANLLNKKGITSGDMVALMMDKSLELMVSILAILKTGAAYVPIELDFPKSRIEYILKDTNSKVILINGKDVPILNTLNDYTSLDINLNNEFYSKEYKCEELKVDYSSNDTVYVMYTSGTTGKPKGVMVTNRNVVRLVKNTNYIKLEENDRIIQTGSTAFDATTFEYYTALFNGLPVYLLKKQDLLDMVNFEKYIINNKITIMFITTQLLNQIIEYKPKMLDNFRIILTGGEAHSLKHINKVKEVCKKLKIYNVYGPTENTTFSTYYEIKSVSNNLPIGKPISNTTCYVLDKFSKLCYTNMPGELVVGGDGVAKGYLNNKEKTEESFVNNPYSKEKTNTKMYRTGDLTYFNEEGNIEFCGRIDTQVKIRGFRIEPDEINQRLISYKDVKESVVLVENRNGIKVIVAYYTSEKELSKALIVNYLKEFLPQYMIPTYFVYMDRIPLNNSGKADKNKLFELGSKYIEGIKEEKAQINYEGEYLKVYELFKEVLNIENIGEEDSFFDIGGDSLLALKLVTNAIAKDIPITYPDLFKHPTIKSLGDMLNKKTKEVSICEKMYTFDYSQIDKLLKNNVYTEKIKVKEKIGNVLLTGVTGFLGSHILDEFMKNENGKIYCLIRKKNGKTALERLKYILNFFFGDKYIGEIGKRIIVLEEDITSKENFDYLDLKYINDIDTVINSAACVKHFGSFKTFEKINVGLVKSLIKFCLKYNKRLIQISTLSVSGNLLEAGQLDQTRIKPNTIFNETNLFIDQNLDNVYAYTKYLAEKCVYDAIINDGLKAKVMRMGNLTGRTGDGKFQPNVEENAFANRLKTMLGLKVLPENMLNFYLEFTPINYAAKAVLLLSKTDNRYNTYHLFNHNHAMLYFVDKVLRDELNINLKHITKREMTELIEEYSKRKEDFDKIKGIVLDVNKNKELEYVSNITIKSDFTIKVLKDLGFEWLNIDEKYIKMYLDYLFDIGFLKN